LGGAQKLRMGVIFLPFIFLKISLAIIVTMSGASQAEGSLKRQMNFRKVRDRGKLAIFQSYFDY
jgi:hypothetical protein